MDHMVKLYLALWENSKLFSKWLFFHSNPFCGPCMAWLIASLSYASVFTTAKLWSMKGIKKKKKPSWMNHKWNQDCWEKYQQPQICKWYHSNGRKWRGSKEPLDDGERREWNSCLNIQNTKIMAYYAITSWQIEGEKVEAITDFIFLDSKITAYDDCIH